MSAYEKFVKLQLFYQSPLLSGHMEEIVPITTEELYNMNFQLLRKFIEYLQQILIKCRTTHNVKRCK